MPNQPNFQIPDVINPPNTRCICLQIPDNEIWISNFVGILAQPTYWFNWQRTGDTSGKQCADVWTLLFDEIDWGTMSCCCDNPPAIFRYNDSGVYQRSTDGGVTWTDAPDFDYRNISTIFPPPSALGISNTKCQAADAVVVTIDSEIIQALNDSFAAGQILALIAAVLLAVLSAGSLLAFTPLITAIGAAIVDVGVAVTQAAFTDDVWNRLRCNIYCHMDSDSSIDDAGFAAVLAQIPVDETGIVETVLFGIINAAGVAGITNMIRSNKGHADANCDDCCPPPQVYQSDECTRTTPVLLTADGDGIYTLTGDCFHTGGGFTGYLANIQYQADAALSDVNACQTYTLVDATGDAAFAFRLDCVTLAVDFLNGNAVLHQIRASAPFTFRFTIP